MPSPIVVTCPSSVAAVGTPYSSAVVASGGSQIYSSYVLSNASPAGFWGSLAITTGLLTGSPALNAGPWTYTVTVTDNVGATASQTCSIVVTGPPSLSCVSSIPNPYGVVGVSVPSRPFVTASGGSGSGYLFTILNPPPSSISSTGSLNTFIPATNGTISLNVRVTDSSGGVATRNCPIVILPAPSPSCPVFSVGGSAVTQGFESVSLASAAVSATGGLGTYTFTLSNVAPAISFYSLTGSAFGGTVNSIGSGSPVVVAYTVTVADSVGARGSRACSITMYPRVSVSCPSTAFIAAGSSYSGNAAISGGIGTYSVSFSPASAFLQVNNVGLVTSISPLSAQVLNYTLTASSGGAAQGVSPLCTLNVLAFPTISCPGSFPDGVVGRLYSAVNPTVVVNGGSPGFGASGLPPGLSINTGTGAVSGTPTANGTFANVVLSVRDRAGQNATTSPACSIVIAPRPVAFCPALTGTAGVVYSSSFTVTRAAGGAVVWNAPAVSGFTLTASSGLLVSNAAAVAGTYTFTNVFVTDSSGSTSLPITCAIAITASPNFVCRTMSATVNVSFTSSSFAMTGGAGTGVFTVTSVNPVVALSFNAQSQLVGTFPTVGNVDVTVMLTDGNGRTISKTCPVSVSAAPSLGACPAYPRCLGAFSGPAIPVVSPGSGPANPPFSISPALPASLTFNTSTGAIGGQLATTTVNGTVVSFTVTYRDTNGRTATLACSFTVDAFRIVVPFSSGCPVNVNGATALSAAVNVAFSYKLNTTGGVAPFSWALTLPAGMTWLSLSQAGVLSGTPSTANACGTGVNAPCSAAYTVTVTDALGCVVTLSCNILVYESFGPQCPAAASAVISASSTALQTITFPRPLSGTPPFTYAYTVTPPIAGTAGTNAQFGFTFRANFSSPRVYNFCITATDAFGIVSSQLCCDINVVGPLIATCPPPTGLTCTPYSHQMVASGGWPTYTWSISGLPRDVDLSTTGLLTNRTVLVPRQITYNITVRDSRLPTAGSLVLSCPISFTGPSVTCPSAANSVVTRGVAYPTQSILCSAGTCTFTQPAGQGLNVSSSGAITGTYNVPGTATSFTISGSLTSASAGCNQFSCVFTIVSAPTISCPTGLSATNINQGRAFSATIGGTRAGAPAVTTYDVTGLAGATVTSPGGVIQLTAAATSALSTGSITYTIRLTDTAGSVKSTTCSVFVAPLINLACGTVGNGQLTVAYNGALSGAGSPPLAYANLTLLPPGLAFNTTTGVVTGTPTVAGTTVVNFRVTDRLGSTFSQTCTIVVAAAPTMSCFRAQSFAVVGLAFSQQAVTCPSCATVVNTTPLPGNLVLSANTVSANPVSGATGSSTVTFLGTDSSGATSTVQCQFAITPQFTLACPSAVSVDIGQTFQLPPANMSPVSLATPFVYASSGLPQGVFVTPQGVVRGVNVPTQTLGVYLYSLNVTDAAGQFATTPANCQITLNPALTLSCPPDQTIASGAAYNPGTVVAGGGLTPYTYAIVPASVPGWISFSATGGVISGQPGGATSGRTQYSIRVTDGSFGGTFTTGLCNVTVNAPLSVACPLQSGFTVDVPYSQFAIGSGGLGAATYTYSFSAGAPSNLQIAGSTGLVSTITPFAAAANLLYTVELFDGVGRVTATCPITVFSAPTLSCPTFATPGVSLSASASFGAAGGSGTGRRFAIASGQLPPGLSLVASSGVINGQFTTAGTFTFIGNMTDSANGFAATSTCTVTVVALPVIQCPAATASVTIPYSSSVTVTGGSGTISEFTFTIAGSALPLGLLVTNVGGGTGNGVSGTPAIVGTYSFLVNVTDKFGVKDFKTCTIQVGSPGCLSVNQNTTLSNSSSVCSSCATCKRLANPCFNKQCQINVVLILDQSASIRATSTGYNAVNDVRTGVNAFITGMQSVVNVGGTVNMGVITFDTLANLTFEMSPFTPAFQNGLINYVNNVYLTQGQQTNWAAALELASRDWGITVDIFVFFTDGQPEVANGPWVCDNGCYDESSGPGKIFFSDLCTGTASCGAEPSGLVFNPGTNQKNNLWAACTAADRLKQSGAKIFLVGVGDVNRNQDEIQVVSGMTPWDGAAASFFSSDYVVSSNYSQLATLFTQVGVGLCPCLASYPACSPVGQSCNARLFSSRVQVTTSNVSSSTVFPKESRVAAYLYYNFLGGASGRVAYDFFAQGEMVNAVTPTVGSRVDILNPCKLQRIVTCGAGCFNIQEKQSLPRFFLESFDTAGTSGSRYYSVRNISGCTGFTKVYPIPTYPFNYGVVSPEAIRFVWVLNSDGITPCAAEAFDGTLYEFFSDATTRGVVNMGNPPVKLPATPPTVPFSFVPSGTCTVPNCTNPVEMLFVIDEQLLLGAQDFDQITQFVMSLINGASNPASQFGWIWSWTGFEVPALPLLPQTGSLATLIRNHSQARGTTDFANLVQLAVNRFFPTDSSVSGFSRQLVTIVGGPDNSTGTGFAAMQAMLAKKGVEYWSVGVNAGSSNATLLSLLGSTNQYAHYSSYPLATYLPAAAADLSLRLCPSGSLCGKNCQGFCRCASVCECPTCVQDNCTLTRTCASPQAGCFGSEKSCDDGDACTTDTCDLVTGCRSVLSVFCDDSNNCTSDRCVNGVCQFTSKVCTGSDPCYQNNLCDIVTGLCNTNTPIDPATYNSTDNQCFVSSCPINGRGPIQTAVQCNDGSECTIDSCVNATGCLFVNRTCSDNNLCTFDRCNSTFPGGCQFDDNSTACPADRCNIGLCNATSGCYTVSNATNCDLGNKCKVYSCDPVLGCQAVDRVCSDGNNCRNWTCDSQSGCSYTNITCNDNNQCTDDSCSSDPSSTAFECVNTFNPSICATCAFTPCSNVVTKCQQAVCIDQLTSISCSDPRVPDPVRCQNAITFETPARYCFVVDTSSRCLDGNACTNDRCDDVLGCVNDPVVCPTSNCTLTNCDPLAGCQSVPKVCNDNLACTTDLCDNATVGGCVFTPVDCNDSNACTTELCSESVGGCVFTNISCADGDVCTDDTCVPATGCPAAPRTRQMCNDNNLCTTDVCDAVLGCVYTPIPPCNDNLNCTLDFCDKDVGCRFTPRTCPLDTNCTLYQCSEALGGVCVSRQRNCTDSNPCTIDTCDESIGCVNTNISCNSPSKCEIWQCVPALGVCNKTADVVCDDGR